MNKIFIITNIFVMILMSNVFAQENINKDTEELLKEEYYYLEDESEDIKENVKEMEEKKPVIIKEDDQPIETVKKEDEFITLKNNDAAAKETSELYLGIEKKEWLKNIPIIKKIPKENNYTGFFQLLLNSENDWYMKQMLLQSSMDKKKPDSLYMYHKKNLDKFKNKPITLASTVSINLDDIDLQVLVDIMYYLYFYRPDTTEKELTDTVIYSSGLISRGVNSLKVKNMVIQKLDSEIPIPIILDSLLKETPNRR